MQGLLMHKVCRKTTRGAPNDSPQRALQNFEQMEGQKVPRSVYQLVIQQPQIVLVDSGVCCRSTHQIPTQTPTQSARSAIPAYQDKIWREGPVCGSNTRVFTP